MTLSNADIETDLFYQEPDPENDGYTRVMRRGLVEARETDNALTGGEIAGASVCLVPPDAPDGAADEIVSALNRRPKLEALLIQATAVLRGNTVSIYDAKGKPRPAEDIQADQEAALNAVADEIEEAIVNG